MKIGLISDTHGCLPVHIAEYFNNPDMIIHAGDIGEGLLLPKLRDIAPVHAVRGNMDGGVFAYDLPCSEVVQAGKVLIYVIHDLYKTDIDPIKAGISIIVHGHTHKAEDSTAYGVRSINPGSAGRGGERSVALLTVDDDKISVEFIKI